MITYKPFDKHKEVIQYTLQNEFLTINVLNLGVTITSIIYNDSQDDVVLGYDSLEEYQLSDTYFGATIGRVANRIDHGKLTLNGKQYQLNINDNHNTLHGGPSGFHTRLFKGTIENDTIKFEYVSKDNEEGFPGELKLCVRVSLKNQTLCIEYEAMSDADTIINFTNHSYFAMQKEGKGSIDQQILKTDASLYAESDPYLKATGNLLNVEGTPFDFREGKLIGKDIDHIEDEQIKFANGYDHYMRFHESDEKRVTLYDPLTKHQLIVETDLPGFHLYVPNYHLGHIGKGGKLYKGHCAVCLETSFLPDAINLQDEPETILKKDQLFTSITTYHFS